MRKFLKNPQAGVTFVEVLVSATLVVIIASAVTAAIYQTSKGIQKVQTKTAAQVVPNEILALLSNTNVCKANMFDNYPTYIEQLTSTIDNSFRTSAKPILIRPMDIATSTDTVINLNYSVPGYGAGQKIGDFKIDTLSIKFKAYSANSDNIALVDLIMGLVDPTTGVLMANKTYPLWIKYSGTTVLGCSSNTAEANQDDNSIKERLCESYGPRYYQNDAATYSLDDNGNCIKHDGTRWDWYISQNNVPDASGQTYSPCPDNAL